MHEAQRLAATSEALVVERPVPTDERPQQLCLDKGDDNPPGRQAAAEHGDTPHSRRIGEEPLAEPPGRRSPARRWGVERTLAWLSKCRALLVRYDKHARNHLALLKLACALLWRRRHGQRTVLR